MKRLIFPLLGMAAMAAPLTAVAGECDAEGYPLLYVAGDDLSGWQFRDDLRMDRDALLYTIKLSSLSGEFKISNDDWTINYGVTNDPNIQPGPDPITTQADGPNFIVEQPLQNVTITLEYDPDNNRYARMWVSADGGIVVNPNPGYSNTLPVLYINVYDENGKIDNEVISYSLDHKNYFSGEYWLDVNGCEWMMELGAESIGSADEPLPLEIKARGNWTRKGFSKKPFKLKLGKKQSMLGLSKSKHFAILAHADDNCGYLRNFTGFNLGNRIGLPWTPSQQPVEVVINGDYRGLYFLTESIRIDSERINITELDDNVTDPTLASGGYLIELDNYDEDPASQLVMEEKGGYPGFKDLLRVTFDTPEVYSDLQRMFITDQFTAINDLVGSASDDLWSYVDLDDAARYYLVCEIMSHVEAYHGSTYMFRDRGEDQKWHFSPLWDFGNGFVGPSNGYIYDNAPYGMTWVGSFTLNEKFREKVRDTWKWFMSTGYDGIYDDMQTICSHLEKAAEADYRRWHDQWVPDGGQPVTDNRDLSSKLRAAQDKLKSKVEWLSSQFGNYGGVYSEPERDTTPAAKLPEYITTGVDQITSIITATDSEATLYDLQGRSVSRPVSGEIYLLVTPAGSTKIMAR